MQLKRDKNVLMMELVRLRRQQEVRNQPHKVQCSCKSEIVSCLQRWWRRRAASTRMLCGQAILWACWACCLGSDLVLVLYAVYAAAATCSCSAGLRLQTFEPHGLLQHLPLLSRGTLHKGAGLLVSLPCCCRCRRRRWPGCRGAWTPQSSASSR